MKARLALLVLTAVATAVFICFLIVSLARPREPAEDCVALRERWVSDLILTQRPGCHADSWSAGLYCNNDAGGGSRVASRAY